jgi:hypothetical protein
MPVSFRRLRAIFKSQGIPTFKPSSFNAAPQESPRAGVLLKVYALTAKGRLAPEQAVRN